MNSKTSIFKKSLFKKDWSQIKAISIFYGVFLFFFLPLNNLRSLQNIHLYNIEIPQVLDSFLNDLASPLIFDNGNGVVTAIIAFFLAIILLGEEKRKQTMNFIVTLPYSRLQIYSNKVFVALTALFLPLLVNALTMFFLRMSNEYLIEAYAVSDIFLWFGASLALGLAIFSFTFFFGGLTANFASQAIISFIFLVFPMGFLILLGENIGLINQFIFRNSNYFYPYELSYLLDFVWANILLPSFATPIFFLHETSYSFTYLLLSSLIFLVLGFFLFNKNKMEFNGEVLAFKGIENFFKFGVAICTALLVGIMLPNIILENSYCLILGWVSGFILGWQIINYFIKTTRNN